jgi:hypothetical protein
MSRRKGDEVRETGGIDHIAVIHKFGDRFFE